MIPENSSILILCVGRSGSTALTSSFHKSFKIYQEPLNHEAFRYNKMLEKNKNLNHKDFLRIIQNKNIVVKLGMLARPFDYEPKGEIFVEEILEYFDKIILLDRKDENAQKESWGRLIGDDIENHKIRYQQKYQMIELSHKYNIKVYYYEDIFYGNTQSFFDELDLDTKYIDLRYLDKKYKYRDGEIYFNKEILESNTKTYKNLL